MTTERSRDFFLKIVVEGPEGVLESSLDHSFLWRRRFRVSRRNSGTTGFAGWPANEAKWREKP